MSLRINLILDTERRSASPVQPRTLAKIGILVLAMIPVLTGLAIFASYRQLQTELARTQAEWKRAEPKYAAALRLKQDLERQQSILQEIESYRATRLSWSRQLEGLRDFVPPAVQLTELHVTQQLVTSNNVAARLFELRLSGRAVGAQSELSVRSLCDALASRPPFVPAIDTNSVTVPPGAFRQDPSRTAGKSDRVFDIVARYNSRRFE